MWLCEFDYILEARNWRCWYDDNVSRSAARSIEWELDELFGTISKFHPLSFFLYKYLKKIYSPIIDM